MEGLYLSYENRCLGYGLGGGAQKKLPLLLVTGFLGAGKTTLLRHILENKANLRLAVLVNEIAEVDIDGHLLNTKRHNEGLGICTKELVNGCVCCSAKDDLRGAVQRVLERRETLDYMIVETSGAADPRPVAAALAPLCRLDMVVTLVDATTVDDCIGSRIFLAQLASADMVLLNKCDAVTSELLEGVEESLRMVTAAQIVRCNYGSVSLTDILDVRLIQVHPPPLFRLTGTSRHEHDPPPFSEVLAHT